jgi:ribose-phosphate pyrophosphokinase
MLDLPLQFQGNDISGAAAIRSYPSGEPLITDPGGDVRRILLRPRSMLEFMGGMFFADALAERGLPAPELVLPFVPGARQDRLNDKGDYLFTAKSIAKEINARHFKRVTILDPHSDVIAALIDRCHVVHAHECFLQKPQYHKFYQAVVSPDAGAEKRAMAVARALGVPLIHAWKTRDVATGEISGFGTEPLMMGRLLVVDDICDGGGTFVGLGMQMNQPEIVTDLYVTHGIFSKGTEDLRKHYVNIFTTDSIIGDRDRPNVEVIDVCKKIMEGQFS